ncbi:conserved hypothetical protein [Coccidioides posadasii str. Silveira]|uniref:Uncharacterized protein n=1 Tax=Coccidioides posadasii (strain RMSCC 757 / Silveira) TaxID=443226 RepID=E9CWZ0_COCPS|nr:conserved hypothetical protein [Coccidioides posadasii str. Silveira]
MGCKYLVNVMADMIHQRICISLWPEGLKIFNTCGLKGANFYIRKVKGMSAS